MIAVTINRVDEDIHSFELSGHAESGPYGYDLVCAAVSAVSFGAVNSLFVLGEFEPEVEQGGDGGYLRVVLPDQLSEEQLDKASLLLEGMLVSLQTIEQDYGKHIRIIEQ